MTHFPPAKLHRLTLPKQDCPLGTQQSNVPYLCGHLIQASTGREQSPLSPHSTVNREEDLFIQSSRLFILIQGFVVSAFGT